MEPASGQVFVGRTDELALIGAHLRSPPAAVLVIGEPGCGKSALIEEAGRRVYLAHQTPPQHDR